MNRIITLAGRRWLAGMSWRSYDKPPNRSAIRAEARALNANAFVQRSGTIRAPMGVEPRYDAGYAAIGPEVNRGPVYALGAALSSAKPGPWIGVFRLNESLFFYIAVDSDGAVIPDHYGEIVGSEAEIELARAAHSSLAEAAVVEGDLATLETILTELSGPFLRVQPVARGLHLRAFHLVPVITIAAALIGAGELYLWHTAEVEHQREKARLAALMQAKKAVPQKTPLESELPPAAWLARCRPQRWQLSAVENGWGLQQYECVQDSVVLTWVRGPGATATERPAGNLDDNGNVITRILPLGTGSQRGSEMAGRDNSKVRPDPIAFADSRANLQAWGERAGFEVAFGTVSQVPGFSLKQCAVTINSPLTPWALTSLNEIADLRLHSLNSTTGGEWVLKGVLYGK